MILNRTAQYNHQTGRYFSVCVYHEMLKTTFSKRGAVSVSWFLILEAKYKKFYMMYRLGFNSNGKLTNKA